MIGEVSIGGVYIPALLLLACVAVILTVLFSSLLSLAGFYRLVADRPVTNVAFFLLILGAVVWLSERWGLRI